MESLEQNYYAVLKELRVLQQENAQLKSQLRIKPVMRQWLELERLKCATTLVVIGFIIGYLIVPSPIALIFPKPVQRVLTGMSCGTNAVYQRLGI